MAMTSWPYVAQDTTDIEYGRLFREMAASDGMAGSYGDNVLKPTGDNSGRQVKMATGAALLRGYMFYSTGIETIAVAAPSAATRVDLLVLELNVSAPLVTNRILPKVLPGTSGSSTPPALTTSETGIYQIPIAEIEVRPGISVIAPGDVTDVRSWMDQKYGAWTTAQRPVTATGLRKYKLGYNTTIGDWEYYNGSTWIALGAVNLASASVTGTLALTKGGTGQTTAAAALNALGIYVQASAPAYALNRVWIKVP